MTAVCDPNPNLHRMKSIVISVRLKPNELDWLISLSRGCGWSDTVRSLIFQAAKQKNLIAKDEVWALTQSEHRQGKPPKSAAPTPATKKKKIEQFKLPFVQP